MTPESDGVSTPAAAAGCGGPPRGARGGAGRVTLAGGWARAVLVTNAIATGVMLGILQWSVFFLLQSYLASTAIVYLLGTCVWLWGSVIGMALPGRAEPLFLAGAVLSFQLFHALAARHPYALEWLSVLLPLVAVMGAYAGRFFRCRAALFASTKWLFFLENTAFVMGMVITAVSLFWTGDTFFRVAPWVAASVVGLTAGVIWRRGHAWEQT